MLSHVLLLGICLNIVHCFKLTLFSFVRFRRRLLPLRQQEKLGTTQWSRIRIIQNLTTSPSGWVFHSDVHHDARDDGSRRM